MRPVRAASDFLCLEMNEHEARAIVGLIEDLQHGNGFHGGSIILEPSDGAIAAVPHDETAFASRNAQLLCQWQAYFELHSDDAFIQQFDDRLEAIRTNLSRIISGDRYLNYADRLDQPEHWWGSNLDRLKELAAEHDPQRRIISRLNP